MNCAMPVVVGAPGKLPSPKPGDGAEGTPLIASMYCASDVVRDKTVNEPSEPTMIGVPSTRGCPEIIYVGCIIIVSVTPEKVIDEVTAFKLGRTVCVTDSIGVLMGGD